MNAVYGSNKTNSSRASSALTTRSKALTVRSPEHVYSSPLWICMAFTASWWPSNTPSVGISSSPWSEDASGKHRNNYMSTNINTELWLIFCKALHFYKKWLNQICPLPFSVWIYSKYYKLNYYHLQTLHDNNLSSSVPEFYTYLA